MVQLPSDIKPGTYVFRTELLALHGNAITSEPVRGGGPQFYTHCFNVEITGGGDQVPKNTVRFPGGYKRNDPGVAFNLRNKNAWNGYVRSLFPCEMFTYQTQVIPGPPLYQGKHDAPSGSPPSVSVADTGAFPAEIEAKYKQFKKDVVDWSTRTNDYFNSNVDTSKLTATSNHKPNMTELTNFMKKAYAEGAELIKRQGEIKAELVKVGYHSN